MAVDTSLLRLAVFEALKINPYVTRIALRRKYARLVLLGRGERCPHMVDPVSLMEPFNIRFCCLRPLVEEGVIEILRSKSGDFAGVARGRKWQGP